MKETNSKKETTKPDLTDIVRKIIYTSLGSAALAKDAVADTSVRNEIVQGIMQRLEKRKDDALNLVAREVGRYLVKLDLAKEIKKVLTDLSIHLEVSVHLEDKNPKIKVTKKTSKKKK